MRLSRYKDPKPKHKKQEVQLNDRYQAIEAEYQTAGYHYVLTQQEKEELAFDNYKKRFTTTYQYTIQNVQRIKHRNQEYLTYKIIEEVTDSNNQLHTCERRAGWRTSPIIKPERKNEFGEVVESKIEGQRLVYEIPFDREFLKDLLAHSQQTIGSMAVARGNDYPPDIFTGNLLAIFNEQEFIECDFEDLFEANIKNFLKPEFGGVNQYKQFKQSQQSPQQTQPQTNVPK